jgi:hypothetical protein
MTLASGTSMGVSPGARLCADIINGTGILYGGGNICGGLVAVEPAANELPAAFEIQQNYPNPFNPSTQVKYQIPMASYVSMKLYDQLGREVMVIQEGNQQAGYYQLTIDGSALASGIYFCRINAAEYSSVIKMSLIK